MTCTFIGGHITRDCGLYWWH